MSPEEDRKLFLLYIGADEEIARFVGGTLRRFVSNYRIRSDEINYAQDWIGDYLADISSGDIIIFLTSRKTVNEKIIKDLRSDLAFLIPAVDYRGAHFQLVCFSEDTSWHDKSKDIVTVTRRNIQEVLANIISKGLSKGTSSTKDQHFVPAPPTPYVVHRYILSTDFVGRKTEIAKLNTWFQSPAFTTLVIEALGGTGKSALAWHWLTVQIAMLKKNCNGVIWWSFYDNNSVDNFIRNSLAYLLAENAQNLESLSRTTCERLLLEAISKSKIVFFLDGVEQLFGTYVKYHVNQNQSSVDIDDAELSEEMSQSSREFHNPRNRAFFRRLCTSSNSKVVITSRALPSALETNDGRRLDRIDLLDLRGLGARYALHLFRRRGVKGNSRSIKDFAEQVGYHPLLMIYCIGKIASYYDSPYDFDAWYENEGKQLKLSDLDQSSRRSSILKYAVSDLSVNSKRVLFLISCMRRLLSIDEIIEINPLSKKSAVDIAPMEWKLKRLQRYRKDAVTEVETLDWNKEINACLAEIETIQTSLEIQSSEEEFQHEHANQIRRAVDQLLDHRLIRWNRETLHFDAHPLVRDVSKTMLNRPEKDHIFDQLCKFLVKEIRASDYDLQLRPTFESALELYSVLLQQKRFDDASYFFGNYLSEKIYYDNDYYKIIDLLAPLFSDGIDELPNVSLDIEKGFRLNMLGLACQHVGRIEEAISLYERKILIDLARKDPAHLSYSLDNYGAALRELGQLKCAIDVAELRLKLTRAVPTNENLAISHLRLIEAYGPTSLFEKVDFAYEQFRSLMPSTQMSAFWTSDAIVGYAEALFTHGQFSDIYILLAEAIKLAQNSGNKEALHRIYVLRGLLILAGVDHQSDLTDALPLFQDALSLVDRTGSSRRAEYLSYIGLVYAMSQNHDNALLYAHASVDESGVELSVAAKHNLSRVFHLTGSVDLARRYVLESYQMAMGDGAPYVWHRYLISLQKLASRLGLNSRELQSLPKQQPYHFTHKHAISNFRDHLMD